MTMIVGSQLQIKLTVLSFCIKLAKKGSSGQKWRKSTIRFNSL